MKVVKIKGMGSAAITESSVQGSSFLGSACQDRGLGFPAAVKQQLADDLDRFFLGTANADSQPV